ncbi:hypothetical protein D3C86_1852030 [compost metagenome]
MVAPEEDADRPVPDRLAGAVIGGLGGLGDRGQVPEAVRVGDGGVGDRDVAQVLHRNAELLEASGETGVPDGPGGEARAAARSPEVEGDPDDGGRECGLGRRVVFKLL